MGYNDQDWPPPSLAEREMISKEKTVYGLRFCRRNEVN